ncbi:uncharacterized protein LOC144745249 [Ciona intestinalis]
MFENSDKPIELRMAALLVLIMNAPTNPELLSVFEVASDINQPRGLKELVAQFLKSQVFMSGSQHSSISIDTAERIIEWANENGNQPFTKATIFKHTGVQEVLLPIINKKVFCTADLKIYSKDFLPVFAEIEVYTEVGNHIMTYFSIECI